MTEELKPSERAVTIATNSYADLHWDRPRANSSEYKGWENAFRHALAALIRAGYTQLAKDAPRDA